MIEQDAQLLRGVFVEAGEEGALADRHSLEIQALVDAQKILAAALAARALQAVAPSAGAQPVDVLGQLKHDAAAHHGDKTHVVGKAEALVGGQGIPARGNGLGAFVRPESRHGVGIPLRPAEHVPRPGINFVLQAVRCQEKTVKRPACRFKLKQLQAEPLFRVRGTNRRGLVARGAVRVLARPQQNAPVFLNGADGPVAQLAEQHPLAVERQAGEQKSAVHLRRGKAETLRLLRDSLPGPGKHVPAQGLQLLFPQEQTAALRENLRNAGGDKARRRARGGAGGDLRIFKRTEPVAQSRRDGKLRFLRPCRVLAGDAALGMRRPLARGLHMYLPWCHTVSSYSTSRTR